MFVSHTFLGVLNQNLRKQATESKTDRCWFSKAQDLLMLFSLFSGKTDKRSFSCFWACGPCAKEGLQARRRIVVVTVNGHRDLHKQRIHCATCFTKNSVIQVGGLRFFITVFENFAKMCRFFWLTVDCLFNARAWVTFLNYEGALIRMLSINGR